MKELRPIPVENIDKQASEEPLDVTFTAAVWSLLGALMWLLQTRAELSPYIGYLQRNAKDLRVKHVYAINRLLRFCIRNVSGLHYQHLSGSVKLVCIADAAYKSIVELTDCIALRGYILALVGTNDSGVDTYYPGGKLQILDWLSKKFIVITRSSFAAELRNKLLAAQALIFMAGYIHEISQPVGSALEMADVLDEGKLIVPTVLCGDSKGVFEAVQNQSGKCKIDQSLAMHVKALREACDKYQIQEIVWLDN